jgi:hypothetical protein
LESINVISFPTSTIFNGNASNLFFMSLKLGKQSIYLFSTIIDSIYNNGLFPFFKFWITVLGKLYYSSDYVNEGFLKVYDAKNLTNFNHD